MLYISLLKEGLKQERSSFTLIQNRSGVRNLPVSLLWTSWGRSCTCFCMQCRLCTIPELAGSVISTLMSSDHSSWKLQEIMWCLYVRLLRCLWPVRVILSVVELVVIIHFCMLKASECFLLLPCNQLCYENPGMVLSARMSTSTTKHLLWDLGLHQKLTKASLHFVSKWCTHSEVKNIAITRGFCMHKYHLFLFNTSFLCIISFNLRWGGLHTHFKKSVVKLSSQEEKYFSSLKIWRSKQLQISIAPFYFPAMTWCYLFMERYIILQRTH